MSRIGKKPVTISDKVKVNQNNKIIEVTGPKGSLQVGLVDGVEVEINAGELTTGKCDNVQIKEGSGLSVSFLSGASPAVLKETIISYSSKKSSMLDTIFS